jgi:hypothetical protein
MSSLWTVSMSKQAKHYLSYLLRLWQSESEGQPVWRALLEKPGTGERLGFACIQDLVEFLWSVTAEEPPHRSG